MNAKKYIQYNVEDWVQDTFFRKYVLEDDPTYIQFWEDLRTENREVYQKMREASTILHTMSDLHQSYRKEGLEKSNPSFTQMEKRIQLGRKRSKRRIITMVAVAASIAIAVFVLWLMVQSPLPTEYITLANDTEEIQLPDGSIVYLNEHSRLIISNQWEKGNREVVLDGEGYFMVRSQVNTSNDKTKFTVKTGGLDIEVLGTQFNVNTRDVVTSIALDEGSIKLIKEQDDQEESTAESLMVPGQIASFNRQSNEIKISEIAQVAEESYWKPETIEFNDIKLSDAINKMETVFGIPFIAENKNILDLKIDKLSVPSDDPEVFIKTVNILFADKVTIDLNPEKNTYHIKLSETTLDQ